ncbi:MAG TPA: glycoside hydrolase family 38 C-terminal domain-containing protein, partial [Spirochaetota bacterium]|nr:glycoside hydrolase family 38 C-terminal domain-containing protein [Spirochaetota bacterium]
GPAAVLKTITNYKQKDISSHALMAFGVGNGGGGPGEPHMENLQRLSRTSALPGIKQEWTAAFLKKWSKDSKKFQTYTGELYLEKHQGTFTTQSSVKYYNKKAEAVLRETEYNLAITQEDSFKAEILSIWQDVLLYQFHDILPGSSIKRVYSECFGAYKKLLKRLNEINASLYKKVIKKISCGWQQQGYTAFNSLNWQRSAWFKIRQQWYQSELPAMGFTRLEKRNKLNNSFELKANCNQLENNRIRIKFARDGSLFSVFDKYSKREVLPPRQNANVYRIYRDYGDAWDFDYDYFNKKNEIFILQQSQAWCDGPEAVVKQFYKYKNSSLVLEIKLLADSSRIDFNCRLNWQEKFTMLRTCFPVNVNTDTAVCGIQFGAVKRPTTSNDLTELARDEVPFHKWTDIADTGYGAALLSENKYGIRVKNNILDLNLLRSVPYPYAKTKAEFMQADVKDDEACSDIGSHFFRYAFYPHQGNYCQGEVVKEAYNFNFPPVYSKGCPVEKNRTDFSFMEILQGDIIIEHVKPAENGEGIILRLYEPYNKETEVSVRLNMPVGRVMLTDLMEKNIKNIPFKNNCFTVRFKPFAVKSLRLI